MVVVGRNESALRRRLRQSYEDRAYPRLICGQPSLKPFSQGFFVSMAADRHAVRRWCLGTTLLHEQARAEAVGES